MRDPALQAQYEQYNRKVRIRNASIASLLVIILMPVGSLLDWFVYPRLLIPFFALRVACSVATAATWLMLQSRYQKLLYPFLIRACYLLPSFAMSLMIAFSEGATSPYYAGLNLLILGVCAVMQTSVWESLFSIASIFSMYLAACLFHGDLGSTSAIVNNIYFLTLSALIVLAGNYNYNRLRYQEFVLRHQLGESRQQLEASNLQLRELDEAKSRFFANISHELRTPLTLIAGPIEKLRQNGSVTRDAELSQLVGIMEANSLRLLKMINNLLALVRSVSKGNESVKTAVLVDEMLSGLLASVEHLARQKGIHLEKEFRPSHAPILLDSDKLEKIVLNLLLNAIKFTPADGLICMTWQVSDGELTLEVRDTGIGISKEDLDHVFTRFWQANTSSTRQFQGVGIGLALVRELTEAMDGQVSAESEPGRGSTFRVTIPAAITDKPKQHKADIPEVSPRNRAPGDEWLTSLYRRADLFIETGAPNLAVDQVCLAKRKRPLILVGEDQADMATFIAAQLKEQFDVLIASDGQYAIDMTRQYQPDLLVLDMMMPEKDGLQVCQELCDQVQARGLPILILTARADEETKVTVLRNGATDFLTKPFSTTELQVRCKNLLALTFLNKQLANRNRELSDSLEQLKESEVRMVQHAKMISLGRMSAGIIHEINNPLNYVNGAVQILRKRLAGSLPASSCSDIFDDIQHGLKRVSDLVSKLRAFAHPSPIHFDSINLLECVRQACRLTAGTYGPGARPTIHIDAGIAIKGNPTQISQLFINVIQNAHDACSSRQSSDYSPAITINAVVQDEQVSVTIEDNGVGIPNQNIDKIFDPFFTTKDVGKGMGLGLSICAAITKSHAAHLNVRSVAGKGTEVIVTLPFVEKPRNEKKLAEMQEAL
ncbi:MAG: ATP-binding protein [Chthoniobacterales bacterium]